MPRGARGGGSRRAAAAALLLAAASHAGGGGGGGGVAAAPALVATGVGEGLPSAVVPLPRVWPRIRSQLIRHLGTFSLVGAAGPAAAPPPFPLRWTVRARRGAEGARKTQNARLRRADKTSVRVRCSSAAAPPARGAQDPESLHSWDLRQLVLPDSAYVFHDKIVRARACAPPPSAAASLNS
jgi:hypothetical protein